MIHPNPSSAMAWVIVDELARCGVTRAVISPGSRSTALVLALNAREEFETAIHIDERSAGFRALGLSAGCGRPGLAVTTSGSAVANLLPAVVEAERSAIPLILLTADRPPEMVRRRTNQTMDQESVFSGFLRGRFQLGPAVDTAGEPETWREAVKAAVALANGGEGVPGPVQINVAFEEPTVPVADDGRSKAAPYATDTGRRREEPVRSSTPLNVPPADVTSGKRSLVIAGRGDYDAAALVAVCRSAGIPILATALSGARGAGTVSGYHHILVDGVPAGLEPDWVYVVGQTGPSDRLAAVMQAGTPVVHADRWGLFSDASGTMTDALRSNPVESLKRLAGDQEQGWSDRWSGTDSAVRDAIDMVLAETDQPTGPGIARSLNDVDWLALVVASSLSIRDVDSQLTRSGWVFANRGLSGIDGFNSTALGVADCRPGTVAVTGDLAFLHDSNAFLTDQIPSTVFLVVDNGGGGLFDLLPQAQHAPDFERLFITPPGRDLSVLAGFHGLAFSAVKSVADVAPELRRAMQNEGVNVVRVTVDRHADLSMRRALDDAARAVLGVR
ncbi:MAG: 2-succinyl-5-enolpyruvyl-6-hydroxy-3-cyclohexene-1-carboxylic-acid synthase [Acidimicrobiia bacterium]